MDIPPHPVGLGGVKVAYPTKFLPTVSPQDQYIPTTDA